MSGLNVRHTVLIGVALVAVAVLAVAVTLLVTGGGAQPERERTVATTSSSIASGLDGMCDATVISRLYHDSYTDLTLMRTAKTTSYSCLIEPGTRISLPGVITRPGGTVVIPGLTDSSRGVRTVTTTSSSIASGLDGMCDATVISRLYHDSYTDLTLMRTAKTTSYSCLIEPGTRISLPGVITRPGGTVVIPGLTDSSRERSRDQ